MDYVDDALIETLWKDLDGRIARQQITKEANEIAAGFENATVPAYVPIFVRRRVLERLRPPSSGMSNRVASTAAADDGD